MLGACWLLLSAAIAAGPQPRIEFPLTFTVGVRYAVAHPGSSERIYRWDIHGKWIIATTQRGGLGLEAGYQKFTNNKGLYVIALAEVCVFRCKRPSRSVPAPVG
jgi:hypothetical protein